jgi:uncharacterized protein YyaL (SSP411 family)
MAARVLVRLAALTGDAPSRAAAERALGQVTSYLARYPTGFGNWLSAFALVVDGIAEVAVVGDPADPATRALLAEVHRGGRPNVVVAVSATPDASAVPLLAGRATIEGRPTAYVCREFACRLPVTEAGALADQLRGGAPS